MPNHKAVAASEIEGNPDSARLAREHNDANVLCLAGDLIGEHLAERVVETWLGAEFAGGRHSRRLQKIAEFEKAPVQPSPP